MRRLLIITSEYPPFAFGGIGRYIYEIIPLLSKRFKIHILCIPSYSVSYSWDTSPHPIPDVHTYFLQSDAYQSIVSSEDPDSDEYKQISLDLFKDFKDKVGDLTFDCIFLQHFMELEVARWIARENPTARRVYFSHLPNPAMYSYFDRKNSMKRHQELEGFCLVWAEVILTPSQYSKRVLTSTYSVNEARIKVLPHGGILPGTKPTNNRQPKSFATVGRFTEQKGWGTLVNLIDAMKENGVTQRWFIIGDGRLRPTLVEMIRKRLPHENVQFFRMMDPNEFPELFRSVKYYVQTSDYESFGLAAMEAALNGCVPILTDIPPFREVFGAHKSVCFFQPGHFSEVLSLVNLDSSKDTDSAEANAEEFFSHCWTWERHINELSHLLY